MGAATMGRVLVEARVENLKDAWEAERGIRPETEIRTITIPDALVDSGATLLALPTGLIQQLGLAKKATKRGRTASGVTDINVYEPVRLVIQGRDCVVEVSELPDGSPALIGQIPLEVLDFVIDMRNQRLIGNPAHGGEQLFDMF